MLPILERDGLVELRVAQPCRVSNAVALVADLVGAARQIAELTDPVRAVILDGTPAASFPEVFFLESVTSAAEADAVVDAGWAEATDAIAGIAAPTIALIPGDAVGPAWELALACDLRVASTDAVLGSPDVGWARIPAAGGTQRLARIVGTARALELLLTAHLLTGAEALEVGLVHRAVARDSLPATAREMRAAFASTAPIALAFAKEAAGAIDLPLAAGLRLEADLTALLQTTADRTEGLSAFLSKRTPVFKGQ